MIGSPDFKWFGLAWFGGGGLGAGGGGGGGSAVCRLICCYTGFTVDRLCCLTSFVVREVLVVDNLCC